MSYQGYTEALQEKARQLLEQKEVGLVIGYGQGSTPQRTRPIFIKKPEEASNLLWNQFCVNNLALYLTRPELKKIKPKAIVAKGCDVKALCGLLQEKQLVREDLYIIAPLCQGVGEPLAQKCSICEVMKPTMYDFLLGQDEQAAQPASSPGTFEPLEEVNRLKGLMPHERWLFWQKHFERCIRCYACRNICPLCHCRRCIVEKTRPQWIESSPHQKGNTAWNIIRAFHLSGRCIGCGECTRACPMDIPLHLLNLEMAKMVEESFQYKAGLDPEVNPPLITFKAEDEESFIR